MRGSPIRTPSDQRSVGSSPRLIAASHVLHRLLMPRHPPCALNNLATKMLASTVQFSKYGRTHHHRSPQTHTQHPINQGPWTQAVRWDGGPPQPSTKGTTHHSRCLFPQDPTVCRTTDHSRPVPQCQRSTHMSKTHSKTSAQNRALGTHTNPINRIGRRQKCSLERR